MNKKNKVENPQDAKTPKLKGLASRLRKKDTTDDNSVPRITNDSIEQHRKEVIKDGRKYVYPIINTPRRVVGLSLLVALVSGLMFSGYILLQLYRFNSNSDFIYNVTKVVPLPVARVGGQFVPYEDYLFELRRFTHYFETQQNVDFESTEGQESLAEQRERSIQRVIDNAYIKRLARQNNIQITDEELDTEIELLRAQNKLGDGQETFEEVLRDFWGWSVDDFRTSVRIELLRQKVAFALDNQAVQLAEDIQERLAAGEAFEDLALEYSADAAGAGNGGEYGFLLDLEGQNEEPKVLEAAFNTEIGEVSGTVNVGYRLEIIKPLEEIEDGTRRAAHITLPFVDITPVIDDLKDEQPARVYIRTDE